MRRQLLVKSEYTGYSNRELDELWAKVRQGKAWKERFGERADDVRATLRTRR